MCCYNMRWGRPDQLRSPLLHTRSCISLHSAMLYNLKLIHHLKLGVESQPMNSYRPTISYLHTPLVLHDFINCMSSMKAKWNNTCDDHHPPHLYFWSLYKWISMAKYTCHDFKIKSPSHFHGLWRHAVALNSTNLLFIWCFNLVNWWEMKCDITFSTSSLKLTLTINFSQKALIKGSSW